MKVKFPKRIKKSVIAEAQLEKLAGFDPFRGCNLKDNSSLQNGLIKIIVYGDKIDINNDHFYDYTNFIALARKIHVHRIFVFPMGLTRSKESFLISSLDVEKLRNHLITLGIEIY